MRELKHHPGMYLRDDAAVQFDLFEDTHGVVSVNRAFVTEAEQNAVIRRWDIGGPANRPPNLYEPLRPAWKSAHVQAIAVDTSHVTHSLRYASPFGFYQRYNWDKPHFEFDPSRVRIRPIAPSTKEIGMIEKLVNINGKTYGLGSGKIKHLKDTEQSIDVENVTGLKIVYLTDHRKNEAWNNLVDFYMIEPGVLDDQGFVLDPFTGEHPNGGAWSEDRATRALLTKLAR